MIVSLLTLNLLLVEPPLAARPTSILRFRIPGAKPKFGFAGPGEPIRQSSLDLGADPF